ncbi:uncharacterized protein CDAR_596111 [Caerostris darwini]|uniref:Uncharacterized protein n=1 Tax=Caerostris darwini TaxID=1538125 RepID=A0AAV4X1N1_9ARAC|nr:uncharacterized protein CDAR_596111 [Caerostris darwini]
MFLRNETEEQNESLIHEIPYNENLPSSSSNTEQIIVFPYVGPPGAGPGLLGSKPGSGKLEYLVALERHANSLKSALAIAATLNGLKNRNVHDEVVCNSICNIENEDLARYRQD